jgi:hypothetical protein
MYSTVLLINENEKLRIENQRQKRKRVKRRSYILKGGILTEAETQSLIEKEQESRTEVVQNKASQIRQQAPPKCSVCQSLEHNARTYPERQRTV